MCGKKNTSNLQVIKLHISKAQFTAASHTFGTVKNACLATNGIPTYITGVLWFLYHFILAPLLVTLRNVSVPLV